MNEFLLLMMIN